MSKTTPGKVALNGREGVGELPPLSLTHTFKVQKPVRIPRVALNTGESDRRTFCTLEEEKREKLGKISSLKVR